MGALRVVGLALFGGGIVLSSVALCNGDAPALMHPLSAVTLALGVFVLDAGWNT